VDVETASVPTAAARARVSRPSGSTSRSALGLRLSLGSGRDARPEGCTRGCHSPACSREGLATHSVAVANRALCQARCARIGTAKRQRNFVTSHIAPLDSTRVPAATIAASAVSDDRFAWPHVRDAERDRGGAETRWPPRGWRRARTDRPTARRRRRSRGRRVSDSGWRVDSCRAAAWRARPRRRFRRS